MFTAAAVPERSAALNVCVASSNAAAAQGDVAQAASEPTPHTIEEKSDTYGLKA